MTQENDDERNVLPFPEPSIPDGADALVPAVEALLFSAGEPVRLTELAEALGLESAVLVRGALVLLQRALQNRERGLDLAETAGGWQLRTDARFASEVAKLRGARPQPLSQAALEALSVIAYEQPATRADVERVRGVSSGGVIRSLIDKGLLRVAGRREEPGRPLLYRTTPAFLELFALNSLEDMPTLSERERLEDDGG